MIYNFYVTNTQLDAEMLFIYFIHSLESVMLLLLFRGKVMPDVAQLVHTMQYWFQQGSF
jgi:hypothetical protein